MIPSKSNILHLVFFLLHSNLRIISINAFAAWLVDRPIGCYTFLEPNEVIMNNQVLDVSHSKNSQVYLDLYNKKTNEKIQFEEEDMHVDKAVILGNGEKVMEYQIKMVFPLEVKDAQYVMDVLTKSSSNPEEESKLFKAVFVNKNNVGCEGKRGHGRSKDDGLILQITMDDTNAAVGDEESKQDTVEVWGGWATDHEAVSLTPKIIFKLQQQHQDELTLKKQNKPKKEEKINDESLEVADERKTREEEAKIAMKKLNDLRLNMGHNLSPEEVHASQIGDHGNALHNNKKEEKERRSKQDDTEKGYYAKFNEQYQKQQKFDHVNIMTSYSFWCGALLMCFYIGCFMKYANVAGMRFHKGRRDL